MTRKLEPEGTMQTLHGWHRPAVTDNYVLEVWRRILASVANSLRRLSQKTGMPYSLSQCTMLWLFGKSRILDAEMGGLLPVVQDIIAYRGYDAFVWWNLVIPVEIRQLTVRMRACGPCHSWETPASTWGDVTCSVTHLHYWTHSLPHDRPTLAFCKRLRINWITGRWYSTR
jgi:hypothetical protein